MINDVVFYVKNRRFEHAAVKALNEGTKRNGRTFACCSVGGFASCGNFDAVPRHGERLRDENEHVGGNRRDDQSHSHREHGGR